MLFGEGVSRSWWNPALLSDVEGREVGAQHSQLFGGLVKQDFIGLTGRLRGQAWGLYLFRSAVPDIPLSSRTDGLDLESGGRPIVHDRRSSSDWLLALAAARSLGERLDAGASLKLVYRDLAGLRATGLGLDLGLRMRLDYGLSAGLSLKDVPATVVLWDDGESDTIWPEWRAALGWEGRLPWLGLPLRSEWALAGDLEGPVADAEGEFRSVWLDGGLELRPLKVLALRAGISDNRLSAGAGIRLRRLRADYAFRPHPDLDSSHLVSLGFLF